MSDSAPPRPAVSLLIPVHACAHSLIDTVTHAQKYLGKIHPGKYEIILIPNPPADPTRDESLRIALDLAKTKPKIQVCLKSKLPGKGSALKAGFSASSGERIFFTDADLPYDLQFFELAERKLDQGYEFVSGNRRLPYSEFRIPVRLLPIAYGRHRLGLLFNRAVRLFLPVPATDTQAGIKAMSRRFAEKAFSSQTCPGFFFDLEFFLVASGGGFRHTELPVTLHLNTEKSTVRVLRQSFFAAIWLIKITARYGMGKYGRARPLRSPLKRFRNLSLGLRAFLALRWWLTPYPQIASRLPPSGRILDLGCGHGLLSIYAAETESARTVLGIDHDARRIQLAVQAGSHLKNLQFEYSGMFHSYVNEFNGIAMIDVMHYFDRPSQERLLDQADLALKSGGTLLIREVDPGGGIVAKWNRIYERMATGLGFTQAGSTAHQFRTPTEWISALKDRGFQVRTERCSSALFSDILFVCEKQH